MKKDDSARTIDPFFENLATVDGLLEHLERVLKKRFERNTVYKWKKRGMPYRKIFGELYFPLDEVDLWIKRTATS